MRLLNINMTLLYWPLSVKRSPQVAVINFHYCRSTDGTCPRAGRGADCLPYARSAAKGKRTTSLNKQISPCVVIEYIGHAVARRLKRRIVNREDWGHHQTRSQVISLSNKDRRGPDFESTMLYYFEPNKNVITVYSSLRNVHLKKGNILP